MGVMNFELYFTRFFSGVILKVLIMKAIKQFYIDSFHYPRDLVLYLVCKRETSLHIS